MAAAGSSVVDYEELKADAGKLMAKFNQAIDKVQAGSDMVFKREREVRDIEELLMDREQQLNQQTKSGTRKFGQLETENAILKAKLQELEEENADLKKRIEVRNHWVDHLEEENARLKKQMKEQENRLDKVDEELRAREANLLKAENSFKSKVELRLRVQIRKEVEQELEEKQMLAANRLPLKEAGGVGNVLKCNTGPTAKFVDDQLSRKKEELRNVEEELRVKGTLLANLKMDGDSMTSEKYQRRMDHLTKLQEQVQKEMGYLRIGQMELNKDIHRHKTLMIAAISELNAQLESEEQAFVNALCRQIDIFKLPSIKILIDTGATDNLVSEGKKLAAECSRLCE